MAVFHLSPFIRDHGAPTTMVIAVVVCLAVGRWAHHSLDDMRRACTTQQDLYQDSLVQIARLKMFLEESNNEVQQLETHLLEAKADASSKIYASALNRAHERYRLLPINTTGSSFLYVMIMTVPNALDRRMAMRNTWLRYRGQASDQPAITHRFMIGLEGLTDAEVTSLEREQEEYKDLALMYGYKEAYSNLTGKLLESMTWSVQNIGSFQYMLKADDDTFVRLDRVLDELSDVPELDQNRLYWGYFDGRAEVRRKGKYKEMDWVICDRYLPYALGGGYVVSGAIVEQLVVLQNNFLKYSRFNAEDVSLGLWLAPYNITRKHDTRFDSEWKSRGCSDKYIVLHRSSALDMQAKHTMLNSNGFTAHCEKEFLKRVEYEYNWTALPSDCCPGRGKH